MEWEKDELAYMIRLYLKKWIAAHYGGQEADDPSYDIACLSKDLSAHLLEIMK